MYLIFDTETTGLPRDWNAPITDSDNWPRCVQLAWQLHDEWGELVEVKNYIIRPDGFTIPYNAEKVHGISTQRAMEQGVPLEEALAAFDEALKQCTYASGHNIGFDINIMGAEYHRLGRETPFEQLKALDSCTEQTAQLCQLPGGKGGKFKLPTLTELHQHLFGESVDQAHNAAADVEATARCLLELVRVGVIDAPTLGTEEAYVKQFQEKNTQPFELIGLNVAPYAPLKEEQVEAQPASESIETTATPSAAADIDAPFVHLHNHSQFSVLQSTASIKDIVAKAKEDGMPAVAVTDLGNLYGAFEFVKEAGKHEIKPIIGCELFVTEDHRDRTVKNNGSQQVFLAKNMQGYKNLSKLCSLAHIDGFYYVPRVDKALLEEYKEGVIVLSGGIRGEVADLVLNVGDAQAEEALLWWKSCYGEDFYLELVDHGLEEERRLNEVLVAFARKHGVPVVAANNAFYLNKDDANAHDILLCIKEGERQSTPIGRGRGYRFGFPNQEFYFKSQKEMKGIFAQYPEAIENIQALVDKVETFPLKRDVLLPKFDIPEEFQDPEDDQDGGKRGENAYLRHLTFEGAKARYGEVTDEIKERLDFELKVIENTGYPGYFLIVQDFTGMARKMNVSVGPGRGSAAGSAVAYCIGITNVDPIKYDLLFERFLNPDRVSLPDIDIDFDDVGRSKVIDYVIDKYGKNQVAQIITYGTMAAKSAIRDAGRVLDLPLADTDRLAKLIPDGVGVSLSQAFGEVKELASIKKQQTLEGRTLQQADILEGSVRNVGTHACGVIITPEDITNLIPVTTSKDSDLLVTQFDNSVVESAGMLKMDFLGLKTLTIINDAVRIIKARHGVTIIPDEIPLDDAKTYELFQAGDTVGIFQFESPGMQRYLRELKPDQFDDLIAMNALYRPGPLEYIPNFIARKHGKEKISYDLEAMEEYLQSTYGITVYQEQVMLLSQKLAGFTKGEADVLRKAMGKKIRALLDELKPKFIDGCKNNGHDEEKAEKIWKDWEAFASYAFNKSHSTCYALIAFHTAYLKANYPAEFMAAVLTNNMNDIKKVTFFMESCKRSGIPVLGPDVNESYYGFSVNDAGQVRFGLGAVKGVGEGAVETIVEERKEEGKYSNIFDLCKRINLRAANKKSLESLTLAGAFDSFENVHRRQYFYSPSEGKPTLIESAIRYGTACQDDGDTSQQSLFGEGEEVAITEPIIHACDPWERLDQLSKEKEVVGIYLSGHPLDDFKVEVEHFCNGTVSELKDLPRLRSKGEMRIAGVVTEAQHRTTKTGKPFGTLTIEDYTDVHQIFLFSNDYLQFKSFLEKGWFLFLTLKVVPRKYDQNELELKVTKMSHLAEAREKFGKKLLVRLELSELTDELLTQISGIVSNGNGRGTAHLEFVVGDSQENIQLSMPAKQLKVALSNELLESLESHKIPYKIQ